MISPKLHLCYICFSLFGSVVASAQTAVDPVEARKKPAPLLRAWILPASGQAGALSLFAKMGDSAEPAPLAASSGLALIDAYAPAVAGNVVFELRDGEKVLAQSKTGLSAERYYTAVAVFGSGKWNIRLFDDGPAKGASGLRPVRVVNFAEGRTTQISADGGKPLVAGGDSVAEFELPAKLALLAVSVLAKEDGGPPAQTAKEIDLIHNPSAYVVVGPDYLGRMRPRIMGGGASTAPDVPSYPPAAPATTGARPVSVPR